MRWVCSFYPQLPLEILGPSPDRPAAVIEPRGSRRPLTFLNALAADRGLAPGMTQQSALGLVPDLLVLSRKPELEDSALQALACRAYNFGSPVVLDAVRRSVWVEVGRSISMFGGWKNLAQALLKHDEHLPYTVQLGVAPTMTAAHLIATVSPKPRRPVTRLSDLPKALDAFPLGALPFDAGSLETLYGAGLRRIGEVLAIPTSSLGKRIGADNLLSLQRLLGHAPEAWTTWQPATRYRRRFDFSDPIETTEALLFPLRIIVAEFVDYLKVRDLAIQQFDLRLIDSRKRVLLHPVGLLSPTRDAQRLLLVLRERLDRIELADGVMELWVEADRFEPASGIQDDLFSDISTQLGPRLIELRERLAARLGTNVVRQLSVSPDQRPERSGTVDRVEARCQGQDHPDRPLWLLPKPQRMVPRRLLSTPERIELGWWDERTPMVQRDYVIAEDQHGRLCWVYREPGGLDWHLHGLWQ